MYWPAFALFAGAVVGSFMLLAILRAVLPSDFLAAQTSARSNHVLAARQIGGLAVIPVFLAGLALSGSGSAAWWLGSACIILWVTGLADDWRPFGAGYKFGLQIFAAIVLVAGSGYVPSFLPDFVSPLAGQIAAVVIVVWFTNMINFMDGLDMMSVAGAGIPLAMLGFGALAVSGSPAIAATALCAAGAIFGFGAHNIHPARVFLGDNGSLVVGLVAGWLFLVTANEIGLVPPLLFFGYYLADAGSTMLMRAFAGQNIFQSHSSHAYQVARRTGASVWRICGSVGAASLMLGALGWTAASTPSTSIRATCFIAGIVLTSALIFRMRKRFP